MAARKLVVEILGDAKGLGKELADSGAKLGDWGAKVGKVAAAGAVAFGTLAVGAGAALYKIGETFDEQYDKIRVGTGATGEALAGLQDSFKNVLKSVPTDFDSAGTAIADINTKLGLTGKQLETSSAQFLELSRITGTDVTANIDAAAGAFNAWGISGENQPKLLDEIFVAAQATGVSFDSIAKSISSAQPQLKAMGFSFEKSAALAGVLGKAGSSLEEVMPAMSKAMAVAAKEGKSSIKVFDETFKAIKDAPTSTAAAAKAMEVFGAKAGPKLASMIRDGKLEYQDLLAQMQSGNETILGAGQETQDFAEKWQMFKNRVLIGLEPLASKVFAGVGTAMDKLGPYFDRLMAWFNVALPAAFAYLQPKMERVFAWLRDNVPPILANVRDIALQVFAAVSDFIQTKLIPAVQSLAGWIQENLVPAVMKLWASFQENILPTLQTVAQFIVEKVLPVLAQIGEWIIVHVLPVVGKLVAFIVGELIPALFEVVGFIFQKVIPAIASFAEKVGEVATKVWDFATDVADAFTKIVTTVIEMPGRIRDAARGMWDGITEAFKGAINTIILGWNAIEFKIPGFSVGPVGYGGFTLGVPDIQTLHSGGTFRSPNGPGTSGMAWLQDGERVSRGGSSSPAEIHVYGNVYGYDDFERKVAEAQKSYARRGGR